METIIITCMVILFGTIILFVGLAIYSENKAYLKDANFVSTNGVVIEVVKQPPVYTGFLHYDVYIEFFHEGKRNVFIKSFPTSPYAVGDNVRVRFNEKDPINAKIV